MTRRYGADLVYTQMFNSNSFVTSVEYRTENFTTCPEDRPLVVQFAGHDPKIMLQAARYVEGTKDSKSVHAACILRGAFKLTQY
jgi:tRNA-dihydrouridine synthase 1